mgnify:CR=1 FL=1
MSRQTSQNTLAPPVRPPSSSKPNPNNLKQPTFLKPKYPITATILARIHPPLTAIITPANLPATPKEPPATAPIAAPAPAPSSSAQAQQLKHSSSC